MVNYLNQRCAVYAGSFDPPTNGHLWMIAQAQQMFDQLIVAIGVNASKQYTYSIGERELMLREMIAPFANVRLDRVEQEFLVNYAKRVGAQFVIRGIRSASDYEYERNMRHINADLQPDITTVFLMPPREIAEVSSTMVKNLVGPKGWQETVAKYVPAAVYKKIIQDNH